MRKYAPPPLGIRILARVADLGTPVFRLTGHAIWRINGRLRWLPALFLTTTGRKTGKRRTVPLIYGSDGASFVLIASNYGRWTPGWYFNLLADPHATVQIGWRKVAVLAEEAAGSERERLWAIMTRLWPNYDEYQTRAPRQIPVIVLRPEGVTA